MRKIYICMPMEKENQQALLDKLNSYSFQDGDHFTFVHIFKEEAYPYVLPPIIYPDNDQKQEIDKTITEIMKDLTKNFHTDNSYKVLFHESPKLAIVDYIDNNQADLVVTYSREHNGIAGYFANNFTEYVVNHSKANVLVLK